MFIWDIKPRTHKDLIDQLLVNRRIDLKKKTDFLHPDFATGLGDPFLLPDLRLAIKRIIKAKESRERVGIFADYDADGTPAAALLLRAFKAIGLEAEVFIPSRQDGYGLCQKGIDHLAAKKCSLIVTADLGIRNIEEAKYCAQQKIDLIITDHHLPGSTLPKALAVINPKRVGSKYPFADLCGCGVVFKLISALARDFRQINESFLKWSLDLVAISTIADVVPLVGENRLFAKFGLIVLQKTKNPGLKALYRAAAIDPKNIGAYTVGFQIGPRINTPGRIDDATRALELLTAESEATAKPVAEWLNQKNRERQDAMDRLVKSAAEIIERDNLSQDRIITLGGDWPKGILGPPASRLCERYHRPVILFSEKEKEYTGSARSLEGVNIMKILESVAPLISKYGGHAGAAGLSVAKNKFSRFQKKIIQSASKMINDADLVKRLRVDAEVGPEELTIETYERISELEPFGMGNPKPVLMLSNVSILDYRFVGSDGQHLSLSVGKSGNRYKSIHFNCRLDDTFIQNMIKCDILFSLGLDAWNGRNQLSLNIIDIRESQNAK